jgi:Domain of unknown function (DUF4411)
MAKHWLDADVLIQAENTLYAFEIARPFWAFLVREAEAGRICSSMRIYKEILRYEDKGNALVRWAKEHKNSGLFVEPEKNVQEAFKEIANYVTERYGSKPAKMAEFLKGGDGWIIAHAYCDGGTVVSHENRLDSACLTPKIPNVCHNFGIGCIGLPAMLRKLKFTFGK